MLTAARRGEYTAISPKNLVNRIETIAAREDVREALIRFEKKLEQVIGLTVAIQQIPAPTFEEAQRAEFIARRFAQIGLQDVAQDELHNVYGCYRGRERLDPLVVTAHSDTVFDAETDLSVRRHEGRLYGPGIADNSLGLSGLITLAETVVEFQWRGDRDIWFVANVGEEGLGDLRGMRAVVDRFGGKGTYLVLEGGLYGYICHRGIGVERYRIEVKTPGGHSWGAFGTPNAIHVLAQLVSALTELAVPDDPKTTYNVGVIEGGTTINTIASSAHLLLDLRSEDPSMLRSLVTRVAGYVERAGEKADVEITMVPIGSRPAGTLDRGSDLVGWSHAALTRVGCSRPEFTVGSTDANIPLSRGLEAVCIGLTRSGNTHRTDEFMELAPIPQGLGQALLLMLATSGA
jgi:acetylornithine deacetylase/succinyl-diaminopimelate desuccinylase-like protein